MSAEILPLSVEVASLRYRLQKNPPAEFTDLMIQLLSSKLEAIENSLIRIEDACRSLPCNNIFDKLKVLIYNVESLALSGNQEVFEKIENVLLKVKLLASYISLRRLTVIILTMSAGAAIAISSLVQAVNAETFLLLLASITSASLGLAGMLLSSYTLGQILTISASIFLAITPQLIYVIIAVASAFLSALAIVVRRNTSERLKGVSFETG